MRILLAAFALSAAAGPSVVAQTLPQGVMGVRLLGGWQQADGSRIAAVEIELVPGWHTYWRVPGDAGIPPDFDWSGSRNLASVAYQWPRPTLFEGEGLRTIGYSDALVLPVRLTPADPSAPVDLRLVASFGVCEDICVPAEATVSARLAPDAPIQGRAEIEAALASRAQSAVEAGVVDATCALVPGSDGYRIDATVTFADAPGPGQYAVLESSQPDLWIGPAESETRGRSIRVVAPVDAGSAGPVLERRSLRLTVLDDRRAVDIEGCTAPG
jgi:DsbC/DsbD-like thiol-disulfide interchange protein